MGNINTKHEILFLIPSSFTQGELCERNLSLANARPTTPGEKTGRSLLEWFTCRIIMGRIYRYWG